MPAAPLFMVRFSKFNLSKPRPKLSVASVHWGTLSVYVQYTLATLSLGLGKYMYTVVRFDLVLGIIDIPLYNV